MGLVDFLGYGLKRLYGGGSPRLMPAEEYRRVLLIRLDHLGDGVFTLPALEAARRVFPKARITLLGGPWAESLVQPGAWVDEVKSFQAPWFDRRRPRKFNLSAFSGIKGWMRDQKFEIGIDFRGDLRHLLWMKTAGVPVRIGYGGTGGGFLLTHEAPLDRTRHEVESNLQLLRFFQPDLAPVATPDLFVPPEAEGRVRSLLEREGVDPLKPLVVLQVTAGYPSKEWDKEKFVGLIQKLSGEGFEVAVLGAPEDRERVGCIVRNSGNQARDLSGKTNLGELAALLKRAFVYVGLDSGPSHLAVALKKPCVLIYSGVNDPRRWGPWSLGREDRVRLLQFDVFCSPCGLPVCPRNHECLEPIGVEQVMGAVRDLLQFSKS